MVVGAGWIGSEFAASARMRGLEVTVIDPLALPNERVFGTEVGALVDAMTEDPRIEPYHERKAALRRQIAEFGEDATAVYAADKVTKVRELRAQAGRDPELLRSDEVRLKLEHYEESLAMLEETTPEHALVQKLRFELEALRALPPRTA